MNYRIILLNIIWILDFATLKVGKVNFIFKNNWFMLYCTFTIWFFDSFLNLIFFCAMQSLFSSAFVFVCILLPVCFFLSHTLSSLPFYDFNNYHFYLLFLVSTATLLVSILIELKLYSKKKKIKNKKENLT